MSETNLGHIRPEKKQELPRVRIPRRYHGKPLTTFSDLDKCEGHNGVLECRALREQSIYGRMVPAGATFKIAANFAIPLALDRAVEIIDPRMDEEDKVIREAQRLGLDKVAMMNPEDFPERKAWPTGAAA